MHLFFTTKKMTGHRAVETLVVFWAFLFVAQQQQPYGQCAAFSFCSPHSTLRRPHRSTVWGGHEPQQQWWPQRADDQQLLICPPSIGRSETMLASRSAVGKLRFQQVEEVNVEVRPQKQGKEAFFDWKRQWYPVAIIQDLEARDSRQPYHAQLLGEAFVVWKDAKHGEWKAFANRNGATVIPTKILENKLWLWPDTSPDGIKESEMVEPVTIPGINLDSGDFGGQWFARDLPYGADTLIENLVDPAHAPFAHHGLLGHRSSGGAVPIEIDEEAGSGKDSFLSTNTGFLGSKNMKVGFRAPGLVYFENDYTETLDAMVKKVLPAPLRAMFWIMKMLHVDKKISMKDEDRKDKSDRLLFYFVGYAVPIAPGKCRIFARNARNFFLQHPVIPRCFRNSVAENHLREHSVLDGDSHVLHLQERFLANAGHHGVKQAEKVFYMPTSSDTALRCFRTWYNSRGGSGPPWPQGIDPSDLGCVLPREETLDRWAHTKECHACSKAFKVSGAMKHISAGFTLLLLGAAATLPRGSLSIGLATGALASAGFSVAMSRRQQKFVFVDYVHAKHD